jgi:hypothetical protein
MAKPSSSPRSNQSASSIVEQTAAEYHKETEEETQAAVARIKQHISTGKARAQKQALDKNKSAKTNTAAITEGEAQKIVG